MTTTIDAPTMTPVQDVEVLDLELLMDQHPQCTLHHKQKAPTPMPRCTHTAVARVKDTCNNALGLGCAPGIEWVRARIAADDIRCICLRRPSDCWSVMDL